MSKFLESFITDLKSARAIGRILKARDPKRTHLNVPAEFVADVLDELLLEKESGVEVECVGLIIRSFDEESSK